jgi:hypothetical protein
VTALICDTSGLLAYFDDQEPDHDATARAVDVELGPLVISPLVLAELDHFLNTRYHSDAQLAVLDDLSGASWTIAPFAIADLRAAREVIARYRDQQIGLTDASLVVLAERYRTNRILTLDQRHFRVLRTARDEPFVLLP